MGRFALLLLLQAQSDNCIGTMRPPSGIAVSSPWPPLPTNLAKRQVYRLPSPDMDQVQGDARALIEQERRPLKISASNGEEKVLLSEIELAIYWDRHAYEYRKPAASIQRLLSEKTAEGLKQRDSRVQLPKESRDIEVQCGADTIIDKCDSACQTSFRRECHCYCRDCKPPSRAKSAAPKLVRSVPNQTGTMNNNGKKSNNKTEYKGKFRNPSRIADAESRILKNKILNRCCNESVF